MTTPMLPAAELLALPPTDLRELLDAAPGETLAERAAVLGLDLAAPEHRAAVDAAIGGQGCLDPQPANGPAPEALDLPALIEAHKGSQRPMLGGTFAVYVEPAGGLVLVTDIPGRGVEQRTMPAALVKLATNPGKVGRLLGLRG
jgi:hypothetical protein